MQSEPPVSPLAEMALTKSGSRARSACGNRGKLNLMLESRNARKRAESDVQLLANRLQHLKFEEERAKAKIVETEARTQQVVYRKSIGVCVKSARL